MAGNRKLRTLLIPNNNIGDEGFDAFTDAIVQPGFYIEHFDLTNNNISDLSAIDFSKALAFNKSFLTLNMRQNQINLEGGSALREAAS